MLKLKNDFSDSGFLQTKSTSRRGSSSFGSRGGGGAPIGLDGPGFSLAKRIGVVGELVGFDFPYFGDKSIFIYFDIE